MDTANGKYRGFVAGLCQVCMGNSVVTFFSNRGMTWYQEKDSFPSWFDCWFVGFSMCSFVFLSCSSPADAHL